MNNISVLMMIPVDGVLRLRQVNRVQRLLENIDGSTQSKWVIEPILRENESAIYNIDGSFKVVTVPMESELCKPI